MKKKTFHLSMLMLVCIMTMVPVVVLKAEEPVDHVIETLTEISLNTNEIDEFLAGLKNIDGITYKVGSIGIGVQEFQKLLIDAGYLPTNGADGSYGPQTSAAVSAFQDTVGLDITGIADVTTQFMMIMSNATFVEQNNHYIAQVGNCAMIMWPEEAFYIGVVDQTGDLVEGTYYFEDDNYYAGEFKDNLRSGKGKAHFKNGDVYIGEWKNDAMNGYGIYFYGGISSTEYYEGTMKNNTMEGYGTYYLDGQTISGEWSNNRYIG